jgi:cytochrome P450
MESLRLNHPLSQLVKETGKFPQTIKIGARNVTLPPGTGVHLSLSAMHTSTAYWGDESMKWNPERFISSANAAGGFESEVLAYDTQEHFLPWATGQRVCPGKKFSQVEMVAVLAIFFRDYTLQPVSRDGESMEQARRRIFETSLTIDHEGRMLFEISHPETIEVTWKKREDIRQ